MSFKDQYKKEVKEITTTDIGFEGIKDQIIMKEKKNNKKTVIILTSIFGGAALAAGAIALAIALAPKATANPNTPSILIPDDKKMSVKALASTATPLLSSSFVNQKSHVNELPKLLKRAELDYTKTDEEIIQDLLYQFDTIIANENNYTVTPVASDKAEYAFREDITFTDLFGTSETYSMYYNDITHREEGGMSSSTSYFDSDDDDDSDDIYDSDDDSDDIDDSDNDDELDRKNARVDDDDDDSDDDESDDDENDHDDDESDDEDDEGEDEDDDADEEEIEKETQYSGIAVQGENTYTFRLELSEEIESNESEIKSVFYLYKNLDLTSYTKVTSKNEIEGLESETKYGYEIVESGKLLTSYEMEIENDPAKNEVELSIELNEKEYSLTRKVQNNETYFYVELENEATDTEVEYIYKKVITEESVTYELVK
ncbi:MAG: hypothetical protein K5694_06235 [Bacilli bacterium]|nr:hypothetical protein [Bacilli bacterium]